jgi:hypothetical protein
MVRFKNRRVRLHLQRLRLCHRLTRARRALRYFLMELLWRDGRVDDSVGALRSMPCAVIAACMTRCCAGEAVLLAAFRESLQLNFGDAALGAALASLQGAAAAARSSHAACLRRMRPQLCSRPAHAQ